MHITRMNIEYEVVSLLIILEAYIPRTDDHNPSRTGWSLEIPPVLNVGDSINSYTVTLSNKQDEKQIHFSDAFVTAEEDVPTNVATFHCYKIESKMYEMDSEGSPLDVFTYKMWIAPKVGLVKVESDCKNISMVLSSITE